MALVTALTIETREGSGTFASEKLRGRPDPARIQRQEPGRLEDPDMLQSDGMEGGMLCNQKPVALGLLALALHAVPGSAETLSLKGGAYRVAVRLELPHLENVNTETITQICLSSAAGSNNHGIAVLSANNPLVNCPVSNVYEDAGQLAFDIFCEGKNTARAKAHYEVRPDNFSGRIVMQMGGKNMTMTEVQSGYRIGECEDREAPAL
jgi:hypothetical protein